MVALLRYELKSTARTFLPMYAAFMAVSVIIGVASASGNLYGTLSLLSGVPFLVFFALAVAILVLTLVVVVTRFSRSLLGDEGYLMFTLPVSTDSLILSKLIVAVCWFILSGVCLALGIFIIAGSWLNAYGIIENTLGLINPLFIENAALYISEYILSVFVQSVSSVLMIYAAISVGHLARSGRGLLMYGAFFGFIIIQGIVGGAVTEALYGGAFAAGEYLLENPGDFSNKYSSISLVGSGLSVLYSAAYYAIIRHVIKYNLNL